VFPRAPRKALRGVIHYSCGPLLSDLSAFHFHGIVIVMAAKKYPAIFVKLVATPVMRTGLN